LNFKLLFPTFRNRYQFVSGRLKKYAAQGDGREAGFGTALNLGTGEGDYDRMIARYCTDVIGCDVNEEDLAHARMLNKGVMNLRIRAQQRTCAHLCGCFVRLDRFLRSN